MASPFAADGISTSVAIESRGFILGAPAPSARRRVVHSGAGAPHVVERVEYAWSTA